jgi:hypothetical protein
MNDPSVAEVLDKLKVDPSSSLADLLTPGINGGRELCGKSPEEVASIYQQRADKYRDQDGVARK